MSEILEERIRIAKDSRKETEHLLMDYLPFIKKNIIGMNHGVIDYDDMLVIGMMAFTQSVQSYHAEKGTFLAYASKVIKNRIIDEERRELKHSSKFILLHRENENGEVKAEPEEQDAVDQYQRELERKALAEEINDFSTELTKYQIQFSELPRVCPKHKKSRELCSDLAMEIKNHPELSEAFVRKHRLPQAELALKFHISVKTIEKHRKYIVAMVVLMMGDYPNIHTFIPKYREAEG